MSFVLMWKNKVEDTRYVVADTLRIHAVKFGSIFTR